MVLNGNPEHNIIKINRESTVANKHFCYQLVSCHPLIPCGH